MTRLNEVEILNGVKNANIYGYHDRKNLGLKIKTSQMRIKDQSKEAYLRRNDVDIAEWDGANADRRGKKDKLEYLGSEPMLWSKNEFNNSMGGGRAENSGFASGGDFNNFDIQKIEDSGKADINSYNPAPFKINLDMSSQKIKDTKPTKAKKVVNKKVNVKISRKKNKK